jgi:hypothetical protein
MFEGLFCKLSQCFLLLFLEKEEHWTIKIPPSMRTTVRGMKVGKGDEIIVVQIAASMSQYISVLDWCIGAGECMCICGVLRC